MLIRPATEADIPLILELIQDLAIYEKEPDAAVATAEDLKRDGFGPNPYFYVLIVETENPDQSVSGTVPAGFAFYFFNYSTWRGQPCYSTFFQDRCKSRNTRQHKASACSSQFRCSHTSSTTRTKTFACRSR